MFIRTFGAVAAVASSFVLCGTAAAAPLTHDTEAEFTITANQTAGVSAARSILGNMFDSDTSTMYSLGLGGDIALELVPADRAIDNGAVVELTGVGSNHAESATLSLFDVVAGTWLDVATLFNGAAPGGWNVVDLGTGAASFSVTSAGAPGTFAFTINSGLFNAVRLTDTSSSISGTGSTDGFDIAEFSVTSMPVSEPGLLGLLGLGLAGVGAVARRR
ncbi:MAG: hypothetical protein LPL00_02485 [Alphaproteobacteria bacterium]|nr:hypothetical protein [Alphaproteobacteria bacterium]MDX5368295.1 hypothetical protein [Alphaproteobacteria bacterium]MDX5463101.1 hypothetical protein [Alphaproteobacteria bacterium]